jgi:hypothetical protein
MESQGHLYELVIVDKSGTHSSVEPVTKLVGLLWEGHTDRHEGNRPAIPLRKRLQKWQYTQQLPLFSGSRLAIRRR